jgi:Cd2+/Zn2+-exporting ATPase
MALPGRGVQGRIGNQDLILGNHRLIEERKLCGPAIEARLVEHEAQGRTMTLLANESGVLAIFAVADTIKPHAREAISALHAWASRQSCCLATTRQRLKPLPTGKCGRCTRESAA